MRNFLVWNKALILRLVWLLFSNSDSLWVAWNKEYRLKRTNFWMAEVRLSDSWIWRALLSLHPLAKKLLGCSLGNGQSASYWFDNWSLHGPLIEFIGLGGPIRMSINIKSTVAAGCGQSGWLLPSARCRNPSISRLRETLLLLQPPLAVSGLDSFTWGT